MNRLLILATVIAGLIPAHHEAGQRCRETSRAPRCPPYPSSDRRLIAPAAAVPDGAGRMRRAALTAPLDQRTIGSDHLQIR
jgi:hypothetical protein